MPKTVYIDNVGELTLVKRKGARNLRLSVSADGGVRISMPAWMPYGAGIKFAASKTQWILAHTQKLVRPKLKSGDRIGKHHTLSIRVVAGQQKTTTKITPTELVVSVPSDLSSIEIEAKVTKAAEKILSEEAGKLLSYRLGELSRAHGLRYNQLRIRKLRSRWGSCSAKKDITLSIYLMQLPWELIDYVLLHELVHTVHMHHGTEFWQTFERILPGAKKIRKEMRVYQSGVIIPSNP